MPDFYSRVASASLIKEVTANTPLTPTTFFPLMEEDIATNYAYSPSMPVQSNRALNLRAIKNRIPAPAGSITVGVEPKTWGHFLNGIFGGVTSGRWIPISSPSGTFTVGETITGGSSGATGVVALYSAPDFLLITSPVGTFTAGETVTGGSSAATGVVTSYDATVYGHTAALPASSLPTYTLQFNFADSAIRYMGVRFHALDTLGQKDNIITAGIKVMAQGQFRQAKITAVTTSGAGAKTLTMDQTYGLVAADVIKLYRPGTGFLDFASASVKTHTLGTVASTTTITVTNLQTSTAVGDLLLLAPQTASYTIGTEFPWIGGSYGYLGASLSTLATEAMEDFTYIITNDVEERHSAQGNLFKDQFPTAILQKGVRGNGTFKAYYQDEDFYRNLRTHTAQAFRIKTLGDVITGTIYNQLWVTFPEVQIDPYQTNISTDDIIDEEVPFSAFYNTTYGHMTRSLIVNTIASY